MTAPEIIMHYEKDGGEVKRVVDAGTAEGLIEGITALIRETAEVTGYPETAIIALATVKIMKGEQDG